MENPPGTGFERLRGECLCKKGCSERKKKCYRESGMRAESLRHCLKICLDDGSHIHKCNKAKDKE